MAMLVGKPVLGFALGSGFREEDIVAILLTLLCLVGWILASAAGIFAVVELLARLELRKLAGLAGALVLAVTGMAAAGAAVAGIEGVAGALSIVTSVTALLLMRWAFGAEWLGAVAAMCRATARELAVLGAAFAPSAVILLVVGATLLGYLSAGALAAVLVIITSRIGWPREWRALLSLAGRPSRSPVDQPGVEGDRTSALRA
jgi:hypothetical protein